MFGYGERANSMSECRLGDTEIRRPSTGKECVFSKARAGDFFTFKGRLYLKINLVDAVEVQSGNKPVVGTDQFSASCPIHVEDVEIRIK